ncbi:MAG: hypothetical protein ONB44_01605 [candidate division KSB1 bacterium]|nr:hypothetical protein [candidate division KSB1 bacterium]MDZ7300816.1 hypothetical protein [candidate division KSB1 bacterium]MDZ7309913.1 hypothetical protein [candidate division KSB1 bacterium]
MPENLAEIVHPLVDNGLYENAEAAVKDLMASHILHQIEHYRAILEKFEKKYGMKYVQFSSYLKERAQKLPHEPSSQKRFMLEEEDALDWKIATEMLESWLGLRRKGAK